MCTSLKLRFTVWNNPICLVSSHGSVILTFNNRRGKGPRRKMENVTYSSLAINENRWRPLSVFSGLDRPHINIEAKKKAKTQLQAAFFTECQGNCQIKAPQWNSNHVWNLWPLLLWSFIDENQSLSIDYRKIVIRSRPWKVVASPPRLHRWNTSCP